MEGLGKTYSWWDRESDFAGRAIRQDVRTAAKQLWDEACRRSERVLADRTLAADLMEHSVAEISRYLNRVRAPLSRPKHGLLIVAFCRALRRHAAKMRRLEFVGASSELSDRSVDESWIRKLNARLDLENKVRQLSPRNGQVLMLRAAGFDWPEIAQRFGSSVVAVRNSFWREVARIRAKPNLPSISNGSGPRIRQSRQVLFRRTL
jgi:hypothetical protein